MENADNKLLWQVFMVIADEMRHRYYAIVMGRTTQGVVLELCSRPSVSGVISVFMFMFMAIVDIFTVGLFAACMFIAGKVDNTRYMASCASTRSHARRWTYHHG